MSYETLEKSEPAILVGGLTALGGFIALLGADVHTLQSAATALGISGTQALFTRQAVFSPKWIEALKSSASNASSASLAAAGGLLAPKAGLARQREPAMAIGAATLLGGFLVQFFAGVGMTEALVSATGIAGVQGAATRARVSSPASARTALTAEVVAAAPPADAHAALRQANLLHGAPPR